MPDGRMLSKTIAHSTQLGAVSLEADYLFARCIPHLDKEGRMPGHPDLVKSITCPLRPEVTVATIPGLLVELGAVGLVRWYRADGREVLEFPGFGNHQKGARFDREADSRLPKFSTKAEDLLRINSGPAPDQVPLSEVKLSEVKLSEVEVEAKCDQPEPETAAATAGEVGRYRGRVDLEAYADEHGYGPRDRLIAIGEDITAWRTPTGDVVPQDERLRLLKLADAHLSEPGSKAHDRRSALRYVIAQQFDPFTIQAAAERAPRPGPQQVVAAPTPTVSADEKRARKDQELAAYAGWRDRTQARLAGEPDGVRTALEQEAKDAIGDIGLKMVQPAARERTVQAKMLELYGVRIGTPAPAVAA
jgi:hypothetical protein